MGLYEIMRNRPAINILKQLYDQEVVLKQGYTLKLSKIKQRLSFDSNLTDSAQILSNQGLVSLEHVDDDFVLSITEKGKHFIEVFDQLVDLMSNKPQQKEKGVSIEYSLTDFEKKILVMVYKIYKETGKGVLIRLLTEELFPYQDAGKRIGAVSRYVNKLAELKLIEKTKQGRTIQLKLTNTGFKVMNEQYLRVMV